MYGEELIANVGETQLGKRPHNGCHYHIINRVYNYALFH